MAKNHPWRIVKDPDGTYAIVRVIVPLNDEVFAEGILTKAEAKQKLRKARQAEYLR